jgi:hypothetical protein
MGSRKSSKNLLVLLALAGLTACAGSAPGATDAAQPSGEGISIRVTNDTNPPTGVFVWVVAETGTRSRLGPIPPNGRRSFNYSPTLESVPVYLLAVREGPASGTMGQASEQQSNTFSVAGVKIVSWSVSERNVRIGG